MSDEDRRVLEREARYSQNLANLLACMRDGHVPHVYDMETQRPGMSRWLPRPDVQVCERCGLAFWDRSAEDPGPGFASSAGGGDVAFSEGSENIILGPPPR